MLAMEDEFRPNLAMPHCRIYINTPLSIGSAAEFDAEQAHYLRQVMRLKSGDRVTLFNGHGGEYEASIDSLAKQGGSCRIESFSDVNREMPIRIHIIQCANKSDKIETVLQKATELGAASFQIADSERSQLKLDDRKLQNRLERWRKIIVEAAEQSERTALPGLSWRKTLNDVELGGTGYALHPQGADEWAAVRKGIPSQTDITLAIGPEGGFSPRDLDALEKLGFTALSFGPRVMRTETAAPALLAAIQSLL